MRGGQGAPRLSRHGLLVPGNIDLNARPIVRNPDGSISTVRSMSFGTDRGEVLVPTVVGRRVVSNDAARANYYKTGRHLGIFANYQAANAFANKLHQQQDRKYRQRALFNALSGASRVGTGN